jgi:putative transcriptional regulator
MSKKSVLQALEEAIQSMERSRDALPDPLSQKIRSLRDRLQLTQEEFAQRFGIPFGVIRNWESSVRRVGPDSVAFLLLRMIEANPAAIAEMIASKDLNPEAVYRSRESVYKRVA